MQRCVCAALAHSETPPSNPHIFQGDDELPERRTKYTTVRWGLKAFNPTGRGIDTL